MRTPHETRVLAESIVGEDRVPQDVLEELIATYGPDTPIEEEPEEEEENTVFPYIRLRRLGFTKIVIEYSGSNDEGYIGEITGTPSSADRSGIINDSLFEELRDGAYDVLERHFAGWEINEGSTGTITVDVVAGTSNIHHGAAVETYDWSDTEVR